MNKDNVTVSILSLKQSIEFTQYLSWWVMHLLIFTFVMIKEAALHGNSLTSILCRFHSTRNLTCSVTFDGEI